MLIHYFRPVSDHLINWLRTCIYLLGDAVVNAEVYMWFLQLYITSNRSVTISYADKKKPRRKPLQDIVECVK